MPVELKIPSVGESVTEVYIGEWRKSPGDRVDQDEDVVEVESEKATFDIPAPAAGVLGKILKQQGETAQIGDVIAYIEDDESPQNGSETSERATDEDQVETQQKKQWKESAPQTDGDGDQPERTRPREEVSDETADEEHAAADIESKSLVMPAARRALQEHGLRIEEVPATGPGGRLLKEDVLRHVEERQREAPAETEPEARRTGDADREEQTVPMSPIRRRIAQRLVAAQQNAALLTTFNEVDMSAVQAVRKQHQDAFRQKYAIKLGYMSFFVKAVIDALKQFPALNAEIRESEIVYKNYFDIGVAVSTDKGLMVPVIRGAERLSFAEIEQTIDGFARRAREGKLGIDELTGGTFTITNGGIFGSLLSTPIVNPPQSGVLGMHAIQDRAVVRDGQIVIRPMMYLALTYDHRIVDGREAVSFLKRVAEVIEDPARMLIEA